MPVNETVCNLRNKLFFTEVEFMYNPNWLVFNYLWIRCNDILLSYCNELFVDINFSICIQIVFLLFFYVTVV